jgi:enoyl-[acyl-carrier-protein] reductase (NADH)
MRVTWPTTRRSTALFADLGKQWDSLDGLVHAIAFAPREALKGGFHESVTRESFRIAHDISSYSLAALAKARAADDAGRRAAIVTLSYLGAERSMPNYNVMGSPRRASRPACATSPRAWARGIRVNAISAGPIKTLAAAGIGGFSQDPALRREERAAAPRRDHRGGRQHRRLPALRPRERHHRRGDLRGRGFSTTTAGTRTTRT